MIYRRIIPYSITSSGSPPQSGDPIGWCANPSAAQAHLYQGSLGTLSIHIDEVTRESFLRNTYL